MRKKGLLFLILIFLLPFVIAQNQTLSEEEKAYACLENKVSGHCSDLSPEEQALSLLALAYNTNLQSECKNALISSSNEGVCWPASSCDVKTTALSLLALSNIKYDTQGIEDWLLSHKIKTKDLEWFLEIDSSQKTECKISYDGSDYTITINENKKVSGNAGSCFSFAYNNYWLKIKEECLGKNFTVSCDKDFISTLLYKRKGYDVWYVSSEVESASADGFTQHTVNSYCFSNDGNTCDYEGSLWSVLALQYSGNSINEFLPYLIAFSKDNKKYLPSSFLYYLTNAEDYLTEVLEEQKPQGYWNVGNGKFYDTAIALLSLSTVSSEAKDKAEEWLFNNQDDDGCWNKGNIKKTALLLWAGWPKQPTISEERNVVYCEETGYYCVSRGACEDANGDILNNYYCSGLDVCCSVLPKEESCEDKGGVVCSVGERCSVSTVEVNGEECCIGGECIPIEQKTECESYGYACRDECFEDEEEADYECKVGQICCKEKVEEEKSRVPLILTILILIILVIIAIILRDKIKLFFFKKKRFKKGPTPSKPPFPPVPPTSTSPYLRQPPLRVIPRNIQQRQIPGGRRIPYKQTAIKSKDREFEETMKKLRELGK